MQTRIKARRTAAAMIAGILVVAMLSTITLAWSSMTQRATNPLSGTTNHGGRLHDHFDGENKDVFAENFGNAPIFVRIQLREFMEVNGVSFCDQADIDDPSTWTVHVPAGAVNHNNLPAGADRQFRDYVTWTMGGQTWYMPTFNRERDSIESETSGMGEDYLVSGGFDHATPGSQTAIGICSDRNVVNDGSANFWSSGDTATGNLRYTYAVAGGNFINQVQNNVTMYARQTVAPEAGTNGGVITMAAWLARPADQRVGNFWVIDTDGWAYWAAPLLPATSTSLLLDAISLTEPDGEWFYGIHVIGEFASRSSVMEWNISEFGGISANARGLIDVVANRMPRVTSLTINGGIAAVNVVAGETVQLDAFISVRYTDNDDVTWSSDPTGNVSATGLVTTTAAQAGTHFYVTLRADIDDSYTSIRINVTEPTP